MSWVELAFILTLLAGFVGLGIGFAAGRLLLLRSNRGEALVANTLSRLSRPHLLLNNVTLPTAEGTTQIDHILVTESGVLVIETKDYLGWIFGSPNDTQWTQVIYRTKTRFRNPLRQNYGHVQAVRSLLPKLPENAFDGVVVFTGTAEFKSNLGPQVIHLGELLEFVRRRQATVLNEAQMTYVVGRIEMKRLRRSIETDEYHLNFVRSKLARV